jgi:hypothetical protein
LHVLPFISQFCLMVHDLEVALVEGTAAAAAVAAAAPQQQQLLRGTGEEEQQSPEEAAAADAARSVRAGTAEQRSRLPQSKMLVCHNVAWSFCYPALFTRHLEYCAYGLHFLYAAAADVLPLLLLPQMLTHFTMSCVRGCCPAWSAWQHQMPNTRSAAGLRTTRF